MDEERFIRGLAGALPEGFLHDDLARDYFSDGWLRATVRRGGADPLRRSFDYIETVARNAIARGARRGI